jgi:hypothetical protein
MFGAEHKTAKSDGVSIPRMINLLLEGFDPARRPLLFYVEFWPRAPVRDGAGSIVQIWQGGLRRDQQFARALLIGETAPSVAPAAIAGVLRVVYPDAASTMPFFGVSAVP